MVVATDDSCQQKADTVAGHISDRILQLIQVSNAVWHVFEPGHLNTPISQVTSQYSNALDWVNAQIYTDWDCP